MALQFIVPHSVAARVAAAAPESGGSQCSYTDASLTIRIRWSGLPEGLSVALPRFTPGMEFDEMFDHAQVGVAVCVTVCALLTGDTTGALGAAQHVRPRGFIGGRVC